jgi:two-component system, sensor histidine kinase RegB
MSAIPTDDTLSRGGLPRGKLSQATSVPPTLSAWLPGEEAAQLAEAGGSLRAQLRTLGLLRAVATLALLSAIVLLMTQFDVALPMPALLIGLALLVAANIWLFHRLEQPQPVSEREFLSHLMVDMLGLGNIIYWLGGAAHNPFADLFVIYVGLAALVLRRAYVGVAVAVALGLYLLLVRFHHDVSIVHPNLDHERLEELGHLVHFLLFGAIVAYFGFRLSQTTRGYCELRSRARERDMRGESAINLAALAAGTAHEMGTPLTTISVLVSDLRDCRMSESDRAASLQAITDAVQACKHSLGDMVTAIGAHQLNETRRMPSRQMLGQLVERFRPMRPSVPLAVTMECPEHCLIEVSAPLRQALMNLITNAADASPTGIELRLRCSTAETQIDVLDRGPGITPEVLAKLGHAVVTTKPAQVGNGVGVYLANMTITRLGGSLAYLPRDGGGTCARVTLPTTEG